MQHLVAGCWNGASELTPRVPYLRPEAFAVQTFYGNGSGRLGRPVQTAGLHRHVVPTTRRWVDDRRGLTNDQSGELGFTGLRQPSLNLESNLPGDNFYLTLAAASTMDSDLPGNTNSGSVLSDLLNVIEMDLMQNTGQRSDRGPFIRIREQPASKALRFRYECEGRSAGSIPGVNSTPENKTFPTIEIVGYSGRAVVVVSCVTKDAPYKAHPHNLVGRDGCKRGVCTVEVSNESMTMSFDHLGIQCVKKKDIEEALKAREEIRVDPFRQGFAHKLNPSPIDLNAVRLCFQAFLENEPGKFKRPLTPVVTEIIYDKKALCDLAICKLSHCSASVAGGLTMMLLCEKVTKDDISVVFYEEKNDKRVWEDQAEFTPTDVHKQVAITFRTPKYKSIQVEKPVQVLVQLKRPSDGETSFSVPFMMTPLDSGCVAPGSKRSRRDTDVLHPADNIMVGINSPRMSPNFLVKAEPADASPSYYQGVHQLSPVSAHAHNHRTPSPMDYQPSVSPNYQFAVPIAYPLSPHHQVSPHHLHHNYEYAAAGSSLHVHMSPAGAPQHVYVPAANITEPTLQNGNNDPHYLDISENTLAQALPAHAMVNLDIGSRELDLNLSAELANLSCEPKKATQSQENMSESLTNIMEEACDKFNFNGHQNFQ